MINNKQVNIWRGDQEPPTNYHVWIYKESNILLHNGKEWVLFINDKDTANKLLELEKRVDEIDLNVDKLITATINNKLITDNPVLSGNDILLKGVGNFVDSNSTLTDNILKLDSNLTTLIIE